MRNERIACQREQLQQFACNLWKMLIFPAISLANVLKAGVSEGHFPGGIARELILSRFFFATFISYAYVCESGRFSAGIIPLFSRYHWKSVDFT